MKKLTPKFKGIVKDKKLHIYNSEIFYKYLGSLECKEIQVIIKKWRKNRSTKQNSYYWLCLTHIGNEIGEDPETLHDTFKAMFLIDRSKRIPIVRSTTTLNTAEFFDYMEKIARRVAEIDIQLPNPEDYYVN
ncbi:MAG: hypothetical protein V1779_17790 [bacterium]